MSNQEYAANVFWYKATIYNGICFLISGYVMGSNSVFCIIPVVHVEIDPVGMQPIWSTEQ